MNTAQIACKVPLPFWAVVAEYVQQFWNLEIGAVFLGQAVERQLIVPLASATSGLER